MKNNITKLVAVIMSFIFMFSVLFVFSVGAEERSYQYIDNEPTVSTSDSFENTFGAREINRVMYNYYLYTYEEIGNYVVIAFTLRVGNDYFDAIAEGKIKTYSLPSGDTLFEGPIDGSIMINGYTHKITVGFSKLESTDEVMVSVTMDGTDGYLVAFSFGENIIKGEVLELFMERVENSSNSTPFEEEIVEVDFAWDSSVQISSLDPLPPLIPPYDPPSDDNEPDPSLHIGENGEYKYQSASFARWNDTSYKAFESNVYWSQDTNEMLVTFKPSVIETQYFANTLGYDFIASSLDSFSIKVELDANSPAANRGKIDGIYIPGLNDERELSRFLNTEFVTSLFSDILGIIGIPTSTIDYALSRLQGRIYANNNVYDAIIEMYLLSDSFVSDGLTHGLPFRFILDKVNDITYEGDTVYEITFTANYCFFAQTNVFMSEPTYHTFYIERTTTHYGSVDIE